MVERLFSYHNFPRNGKNIRVKAWEDAGGFDVKALEQLYNTASLPFIHKHVAAMPDTHLGLGATIGSVVATKRALIPAAVGVDIGCGMMAQKTNLKASDLPDSLSLLRAGIEAVVPTGFNNHNLEQVSDTITNVGFKFSKSFRGLTFWQESTDDFRLATKIRGQMGTLGGGNHFIEICLDENDDVWVMLHSGSRGIGNILGRYYIDKAKEEMEQWHIELPDPNLAYLPQGSQYFNDYVAALTWAQDYALNNRLVMMQSVINTMKLFIPHTTISGQERAINCHHNYATMENHFGLNVWITRKGAVRAREGDLGIIPGSMGTGSFIVEGLGSKDSFCSCSHGAGRVMSRREAKRRITQEDHIKAMEGIEARLDVDVIDESPAAYKNIDSVMAAQTDLVKIKYRLRQVLNIKG